MFEFSSVAVLIWGMLFGAIVPLCVGIVLCAFPYFIANVYVLVGVGVILVAIPYFVRV